MKHCSKIKLTFSIIWIIKIIADYLKYNDYLRYELFFELEHYFKYPERFKDKKATFLDELKKRIVDIYKEVVSDNEMIKVHLLNIKSRIDEIEISKTKNLKKISKDKKIKEILKRIEEDYEKRKTERKKKK